MHEHIPDSSNTYILVTTEDLKNFGIKIGVWSVIGAVTMAGFAMWWERGEDDRKAARQWKKQAKAIKLRREAAEREAQTS